MSKKDKEIKSTLNKIRPFLKRDGGDLEYLYYKDGYVHINLLGACVSCTIQDTTIQQGVEIILQEEVEGIVGVIVDNSPFK